MDRGRRYTKTPLAHSRHRPRVVLMILFTVGLMVSIIGLALYFAHSDQNRKTQAALAASHRVDVASEAVPVPQTKPAQTPAISEAMENSSAVSATPDAVAEPSAPFFQVIGLVRKAFKPIVARNADAVGWITIEGLVDQPIVYRNNDYYLNHDFNGRSNVCGAIFLDVDHPLRADSQNLLLYGHNMKDESMFGSLSKYLTDHFLRTHYTVTLETRYQTFTYLIFAVDQVSMDVRSDRFLYFWGHPSFGSNEAFQAYIEDVYRHSVYTRFLDVSKADTLLTLVTCIGEDRLVLVARRMRDTDTQASLQTALLGLYEQ